MVVLFYLSKTIKPFYNVLMSQESSCVSGKEIFKMDTISFKQIPHQSVLFLDQQFESKDLSNYYPNKSIDTKEFCREVLDNFRVNREDLCDALVRENISYDVGKGTLKNIEKLRSNDCVAVLTGQQAGLFSGPVYTIYKALSAIKFAEKLRSEGINAVPIFWVATEDHDFDEVRKTVGLDKNSKIFRAENNPEGLVENAPVGFIKSDDSIETTIRDFFNEFSATEFTSVVSGLITDTFKSGDIYSDSFTKFLAKLFNRYGLIFASPLNKDLRRLSSPIFVEAIESAEVIVSGLRKRDAELKRDGYHSQVLVEEDFFPFFYIGKDHKRNALRCDKSNSKIRTQDGRFEFTTEKLSQIARDSPSSLSPSALMRPIVQDYLFPTVCYFGGAAEIAYFAQNSVIYEALKRPITPIRHRASFTVIESKHKKTLDKYELGFKDLFTGKEDILAEVVEKFINTPTAQLFSETEENVNAQLNKLDRYLAKDAPTLAESLSKTAA